MSRNGFIGLCIAAIVGVTLATLAILQQPSVRSANLAGEALVPGLAEKLGTLKTVIVKGADGDLTVELTDKGWSLKERNGYPVDEQKVAEAAVTLARMVRLEAKTAAADKLERLELNDPKAKGSKAKELVLLDRDGKVLADLIVGKRKYDIGGKEGATYVRVAGAQQSWLARGELNPGSRPRDWLKRDVLDLKELDIKRAVVTRPDGEKIIVSKASPTSLNLKIENLPTGKQPASDFIAGDFGRVLTGLQLDDVARSEDVPFPKDKTTTAEYETFSGLHVSLQMADKDGNAWVRIKAEPVPTAKPAESTPDGAKVAADINARTDGWVFQVLPYQVNALRKHMSDLLKKPDAKS